MTISIGLVQSATKNADPERLVGAADAALYQANQKGRNRIEVSKLAGYSPGRRVCLRITTATAAFAPWLKFPPGQGSLHPFI